MSLINKIKNRFKNKDVKVLLENFMSLFLLQVVGYLLPLITLPYIAKTIGVSKFGEIAFASAVIVFFQTFVDYGFNYTGIRDIARIKDNKEKVSQVLSSIIFSRIILMLIAFGILMVCLYFIPQFKENSKILFFTFLLIPGYIMYPEWFFQALEKMKFSAILSTVLKIFFTVILLFIVKKEEDYVYIPLINGVGYLVVGIGAFVLIYKMGYRLRLVSVNDIISTTKNSTNMFISLILPNLYTNMSTIFLSNFWGKSATGIFDSGNKFIGISQQFTNVLSRTFYPYLARRIDKHSFYERMSLSISGVISISLFLFAPLIVKFFYTDAYNDAVLVIRIMSISPIFIFMMNAYGTNYLVLKGKENILRNIIIICSVFGLVLSYILVKKYSYIGASIVITFVWGCRGVATFIYANKIKRNEKSIN